MLIERLYSQVLQTSTNQNQLRVLCYTVSWDPSRIWMGVWVVDPGFRVHILWVAKDFAADESLEDGKKNGALLPQKAYYRDC